MAVQKSRKSRSRRGQRRAHDAISVAALSIEPTTGEYHLRHHVSPRGFYKGKLVVAKTKHSNPQRGK
ncbi:MAG: 50S ribosomal protein L32 [uncultured bacterium]|nr:MAG: 50S ribosomal protein L32 [uncultured bacterium]OGT16157.1 MAG: 50S ribosomal protein L32 [Gammaproteobacteria bacterium RIFCSPHIGHO2_02_FULL_38_33]OGT23510.1 MAG: 50S ribosomal protein L32 [Gammaproteobacteria bacterium RIFCSPHIGHO2_12_38_15]OGT69574.1 MAG: 50S ribosomal protein L32 [Gammaproteobacteria bacterium RIFCSPLOWO2_02_FULL_38_11]OGT75421.1 MAG: 50S ribosomal protein L32 [Gammaproteobacteria bacterium RIFCSPLOWO2_12_FULL_38_14]